MGLSFEELFQTNPEREKVIQDSITTIDEKIKKLEAQIDNYRKLLIDYFSIDESTVQLLDSLKQNNNLPSRTRKEIEYYNMAALTKGLSTNLSEDEKKNLPSIVEAYSEKGKAQLKYYDYSSLVLTSEGKKDLNTLNYIDFLVGTQIDKINELKNLKDDLDRTFLNAQVSVENAKEQHQIYTEHYKIANSGDYDKKTFPRIFNEKVHNYQNARDDYWNYLDSSEEKIKKINTKIGAIGDTIFKGKIKDSTLYNIEGYRNNCERIDEYIKTCKQSVPEYKPEIEQPKVKNIINEENKIRKENIEFQKGLLDEQYKSAIEKHDMNFNEQDLKDMSDSILLNGFLLDYSNRDYQRAASDYFMALENERRQKTTYSEEIEFLKSREDTSKCYNKYLNTVDTSLKSNDPNYVRKVVEGAQKIADAAASLQYSIFDTLKFNDDSTTKSLSSYIGLTQCVNKFSDLLVGSDIVPDNVREEYTRAREQIMGFKQGLNQIMEKCFIGEKTTYNQILDQISNKQTYNSTVDTNKINRAFNKLTKFDSEDKTRARLESGRNLLQEQKQKLIDVHDRVLEFAENEKNGNFEGISSYFTELKGEAVRIKKENNHIGLVGKVADQKAKDLIEDQLDSFAAISNDYSKKWAISKLFNLGTYFKLNDMQKELAKHYDENFLKIVREGPGISQKRLTELINGIEPTKENYKTLMLYGTKNAFKNANFSQSVENFNNRYASLVIDRMNRDDVAKQLVILDELNNKNSVQNSDVKESQKSIVNEDIIEKDVH